MLKNIQHKQKLIFVLSFLLALTTENFSFAFEKFGALKKQCRSTCHQAEHIKQSRQDKLSRPECKTCHIGIHYTSQFSSTRKSAELRGLRLPGKRIAFQVLNPEDPRPAFQLPIIAKLPLRGKNLSAVRNAGSALHFYSMVP